MSPEHAKKFGFYSLFSYANALAKLKSLKSVYAINSLRTMSNSEDLPALQALVLSLGIDPSFWWIDSNLDESIVLSKMNRLFEQGVFLEDEREVRRCVCGKVEYLSDATLFGRKTLVKGDYALCCHSHISRKRETVLLTPPLPLVKAPEVFPSWAGRELENVLETLAGQQLLVSRSAKRRFHLDTTSNSWNLDNDILWWLYPQWLQEIGLNLQHLVVGASIIRQAGIVLALSALSGMSLPSVHCLPKILFAPVHEIRTLEQAISRFGKVRIKNALLWAALSGRKEFTLHGSVFPDMLGTELVDEVRSFSRGLLRKSQ